MSAGEFMRAEIAQSPGVFARRVVIPVEDIAGLNATRGLFTIARGSSDAAANILSYEFMRELSVPMTSLPPSVFSLGGGVELAGAVVLVISQSGTSDDLVSSARGAKTAGASAVVAITNVEDSTVESVADLTLAMNAGVENAVPATKTVVGSIAAGMTLLAALKPQYRVDCARAGLVFENSKFLIEKAKAEAMLDALVRSDSVYVIGRGTGFGAAHEIALKLKETCALHAEAYSASEVLHGPLQLVTKPLGVIMLDTGEDATQESLNEAEKRFSDAGAVVFRVSAADLGAGSLCPAAAAAALLIGFYRVILAVSLALGFDPDAPDKLAKVTRTT